MNYEEARSWLNAALIPLECQLSPCNRSFIHCTSELLSWGQTVHLVEQAKAFRLFAIRNMRIHARNQPGCFGLTARVLSFCVAILLEVADYRIGVGLK